METLTLRPKSDRRAQPRIPPHDLAPSTPEHGDIVVRAETRAGTLAYVLHTAPGADQYLLRSRGDAVTQALRFATRAHVRAWRIDDGGAFVLLADFRRAPTLDRVLSRLRAEFLEMPGLRLTPAQVQRLCGVDRALCQTVLKRLVEARFLCIAPDGYYARVVDDSIQRPQSATADATTDPRAVKAS